MLTSTALGARRATARPRAEPTILVHDIQCRRYTRLPPRYGHERLTILRSANRLQLVDCLWIELNLTQNRVLAFLGRKQHVHMEIEWALALANLILYPNDLELIGIKERANTTQHATVKYNPNNHATPRCNTRNTDTSTRQCGISAYGLLLSCCVQRTLMNGDT